MLLGVRDQFHHGPPDVGRSLAVSDAMGQPTCGWPIGDMGLHCSMERAMLKSERGGQTCRNLKVMRGEGGGGRTSHHQQVALYSGKKAGGTWIPTLEILLHKEA